MHRIFDTVLKMLRNPGTNLINTNYEKIYFTRYYSIPADSFLPGPRHHLGKYASPDYIDACANPFPAGVPDNGIGWQMTHSGDGYAGMYAFSGTFYREFIQVQLLSSLTAGQTYLFEMYVVLHMTFLCCSNSLLQLFQIPDRKFPSPQNNYFNCKTGINYLTDR
ncbi:MAG: hypothetical protein H7X71_03020 [Chitinophagales bacterium]|nr:hypothetical protein [Chitinophagales bacterium]